MLTHLRYLIQPFMQFTDKEKDVWVYATGSTPARTRLYRMGITK